MLVIVMGISLALPLMFIFVFNFKALHMIFCGIGILIYSIYLLIDTQLVMGGKRYQLEIDDYILGAMILYVDIIMIFLYLIRLFGNR